MDEFAIETSSICVGVRALRYRLLYTIAERDFNIRGAVAPATTVR